MSRKQAPNEEEPVPFEQNLNRLEAIVKRLEESELPLEESLKLFEEGTLVSEVCRKQLNEAEQKVEILARRAGGLTPEPFPAQAKVSPLGME